MRTLTLLLAASLLLAQMYYMKTGDFHPSSIMELFSESKMIAPPTIEEKEKVKKILRQPFSFLGHGHQTYVFESGDKKYVLKFFKSDYLNRSPLMYVLAPIPPFKKFFTYEGENREKRVEKLLEGYALAYNKDRENTGLVFLQYDQKNPLGVTVTLQDGLGMECLVNLDEVIFCIQQRATPTRNELHRLLRAGNVKRAKERMRQLLALYLAQYRKGILDNDHNLIDNTGFIDERAIRHDVGKLVFDEKVKDPHVYRLDLRKIAEKRIGPWILSYFPEYREEIREELAKTFLYPQN